MTGEDENTGVIHWEVTQRQHCSPTSLSQMFVLPCVSRQSTHNAEIGKKPNEAGPGGDFRLLELQFWEYWDPTDE